MIASGKYDWRDFAITSNNFPITKRGTDKVLVELIQFDRDMGSADVIRELDTMGLRPADLPELLAFGANYPEKQREFPITLLGSVWHTADGDDRVVCLFTRPTGRSLRLDCWSNRGARTAGSPPFASRYFAPRRGRVEVAGHSFSDS